MRRYHWDDLPSAARHAVEVRTGPVLSASPAPSGILALTARTATTSLDVVSFGVLGSLTLW